MNFSIITLSGFDKELKRLSKKYPSMKAEYADFLNKVEANPKFGTPLGKNCYKVRLQIASKGKGKRGGARVITHLIITMYAETLYLLKIYEKGDQDSVSETELKQLLATIK